MSRPESSLPLALVLAGSLLSTDVQAGARVAPGTGARQASGDCSGYTAMVNEMVRFAGTPLVHTNEPTGREVRAHFNENSSLQLVKEPDLLTVNVLDRRTGKPTSSADWYAGMPGAEKCRGEIEAFRSTADAFLLRSGLDPQLVTEKEENVLHQMLAALATEPACKAEKASLATPALSPLSDLAAWGPHSTYMTRGTEVRVNRVNYDCYSKAKAAPSTEECVWGGRYEGEDSPDTHQMVWAVRCFPTAADEIAVVPAENVRFGITQWQ